MTRVRLPVSFFLSVITTVTLFWFLGWLIAVDPSGVWVPVVPNIDFTRLVPDTPEATIIRIPPPRSPY